MEVNICECGKPLPLSGWQYCENCGKRISDEIIYSHYRICPKCSFINRDTGKYCVNCGAINKYLERLIKKHGEY